MVDYITINETDPMTFREYIQVRYAMCLWMLQENVGLSYNEARVYLAPFRLEEVRDLAKSLGVTRQTVYDLRKKGLKKIRAVENIDEALRGYMPMYFDVNITVGSPGPWF